MNTVSVELVSATATDSCFVTFEDTGANILLSGCRGLLGHFDEILPQWPYQVITDTEVVGEPFLTVELLETKLRLSSPYMDEPRQFTDPVNLVCALIVELAWATLRHNPDWLCLHCAAVEFSGRLVVFPNTRRSGKSTLSTCLGLKGKKVFTDDFLPLEIDEKGQVLGIGSGAAVRMRLPWPENLSDDIRSGMEKCQTLSSRQYSYHKINDTMPVKRGTRLDLGAFVLLHRMEDCEAGLAPAETGEVLKAVIVQNFSRAINAARILQVLHFLVSELDLYVLNYDRPEDAAGVLERQFNSWDSSEERTGIFESLSGHHNPPDLDADRRPPDFDPDACYKRSESVSDYQLGEKRFLADTDGYAIHQLDEMSGAIWNVLETPVTRQDIVTLFHSAFPDVASERLEQDITALFLKLLENRLITAALETGEND